MNNGKAIGLIETVGLAAAIAAADAALKSANVGLVGRENSKGQGCITVKIIGEVGAVKAAIDTVKAAGGAIRAATVIPRPAEGLGGVMVWNGETRLDVPPDPPAAPLVVSPESPESPEAEAEADSECGSEEAPENREEAQTEQAGQSEPAEGAGQAEQPEPHPRAGKRGKNTKKHGQRE
jgi:microcompartment protein CcmL/EutN